jgi:hypothetical protein
MSRASAAPFSLHRAGIFFACRKNSGPTTLKGMRFLLSLLFIATLSPAQVVSVGLKAGVPATDALPFGGTFPSMLDTGRWTVGPTIEFHLLSGLSLEADALYRGYRQQGSFASTEFTLPDGTILPAIFSSFRTSSKVWDFPVLAKYRFGKGRYRPFVDAGVTFSHTSSDGISQFSCLSGTTLCGASNLANSFFVFGESKSFANSVGPTGGTGVEVHIGKFKLAPEVRYTHLNRPGRNLATVLLGFTF